MAFVHVFSLCFAEEEQETVVDHFEMQRAGPDELIFAQHEVGDCAVLRRLDAPFQDDCQENCGTQKGYKIYKSLRNLFQV